MPFPLQPVEFTPMPDTPLESMLDAFSFEELLAELERRAETMILAMTRREFVEAALRIASKMDH